MNETREVKISADLYAAAEKRFGGRFGSVDELVGFLLRELLHGDSIELDQAEQRAVEQRLKDLGYM